MEILMEEMKSWNNIWLIITLLLSSIILAITSCGDNILSEYPTYDDNQPITLPENVGYAMSTPYIGVVNLDTGEILAFYKTTIYEGEEVEDFAVGPDGNLYVPIHASAQAEDDVYPKVRVINPASGKVVTDIEVAYSPRFISVLPGGKAVVEHNGIPFGETQFACSIINMNTNTLVNTLYFDAIALNALVSPNGKCYIHLADAAEQLGGSTLVEFNLETNTTVGNYITLENSIGACEPIALVTDSKLYVCGALLEDQKIERNDRPHTLAIYDIPSGKLVKKIDVEKSPSSIQLIGEKAYLTHNDGTPKDERVKLISVIDIKSDEVKKTIELPELPRGIAYSQATGYIYVTCTKGTICVIDPSTDALIKTIKCGDIRARPDTWGFSTIEVTK